MASGKVDFTIEQGATFTRTMTIVEDDGVTPIDLTGSTFAAQIRKQKKSTTKLIDFTVSILGSATEGNIEMSLTNTQTSSLACVNAFYDLEWTKADTTVERLLEGQITITAEVTR